MSVVVECSYVYAKLDWTVINEYSDGLRREVHVDPDNIHVTEEKRDDGTVAYSSVVKTPVWAQLLMPAECQWLDVVSVDMAKRERVEHGRNLTRYDDGIVMEERSRWWQDPGGSGDTFFHRRLEVSLRGVPNFCVRMFTGLYRHHTMQLRQEEADEVRAALTLRPRTEMSNDCGRIDGGSIRNKGTNRSNASSSSTSRRIESSSNDSSSANDASSRRDMKGVEQNGASSSATPRPSFSSNSTHNPAAAGHRTSSPNAQPSHATEPPIAPQQSPYRSSPSPSLPRPPLEDWLADVCGLSRNTGSSNGSSSSSGETGSTKAVAVVVLRWMYIAVTVFALALVFEVVNRRAKPLWGDHARKVSEWPAVLPVGAATGDTAEEVSSAITTFTTSVLPLVDLANSGVSWAILIPLLSLAYLAGRVTAN